MNPLRLPQSRKQLEGLITQCCRYESLSARMCERDFWLLVGFCLQGYRERLKQEAQGIRRRRKPKALPEVDHWWADTSFIAVADSKMQNVVNDNCIFEIDYATH
jgi:hypothetical protein